MGWKPLEEHVPESREKQMSINIEHVPENIKEYVSEKIEKHVSKNIKERV